MSILLALASALVYGVADYCGGRAARSHPSALVTALGQAVSLVLVLGAVLAVGTPVPPLADWWWGAAAGAAGAVGLASFYFALSHGSMTVVAPLSAVVGAGLPVLVGVAEGERPRPVAIAGIVLGVSCVALISGAIGNRRRDVAGTPRLVLLMSVVAGVGFGMLFVMLDRTSDDSGMWPLVAARVASVPLLCAFVGIARARPGPDRRVLRFAVAAGVLDMGANALYLAAVRQGLLSLVAVVGSLYPASTVALAFAVDRERVSRWQALGLVLAAAALVLVTLGRS